MNGSRVDITFHKETPHEEWETLGSFLPNHGMLITKHARGVCCVWREGGRKGGRDGPTDRRTDEQRSSGGVDIMVCGGKCIVGLAAADFTALIETC